MINKVLTAILLLTYSYSQTDVSNQLSVRYGDSKNDYNYNEVYLDTKLSLNREDYRLESIFTFEISDPPEIGLKEDGLRKLLFGFYNDKFSFELGDVYQTWGRGLLLNQLDYQNLDFDTGSRGLGLTFQDDWKTVNIIAGDTANRKSTTALGGYDPRVPNYFVDQFLYGADMSFDLNKSNIGFAFLFVDEDKRNLSHTLTSARIDKSYENGEFFVSMINKVSEKDPGDLEIFYPEKDGTGFYISNTNYLKDWALTSSYRKFTIDVNDPIIRDNIVENYGQALDIQRSPSGFYQHTFRLLSRNSREVNLNDEVGLEMQLLGPINDNVNISVNYMKSSSSKRWYNGMGIDSSLWYGDNSSMPSSSQESYPFEELFIELSGYNANGKAFYKVGIDFQDQVFNVLSNSAEVKSFEITQSFTLPFLVSVAINPLWNVEFQLELQRLKTGFDTTTISDVEGIDDNSTFYSLLSEEYQKNIFLALSANYKQKWSFNVAHESTNSDESLLNNSPENSFDSANQWNSFSMAYKFKSDHTLELFYGSIRGGLDCTNGVCRYVQAFDDGIRIDYSRNFD
ncbi:MAG: DUF6029 family protein [Candidatus Neomarinimicrobiota bacterium]|nr:DUF6029 family protein [Candidatus Neomarinimicrobiota bacterium]